MFSSKNLFLLLTVCCSAAACHLQKKTVKTEPATPEETAAVNTPAPYRATPARYWEPVHTAIDISFNLTERSASGSMIMTLHPYWYATDSVVLDAKSMVIEEVSGAGQSRLPYRYDTAKLCIRLPRVYHRKDTLQLTVRYKALPYAFAAGGSAAITEDRGLYFVNADGAEPYQPVQIWTQGETEASSHWFPTFDKSNYRSAYSITIHVPDSFCTLSNGLLVHTAKEKNGMRADTWQQKIPIPSYLVMMAAGNFAVTKETWKGKEVSYYVPQEYGAYAKGIFQHTPEMMDFYSRLLSLPYPWDKYSQVVTYDYVSGAMENVSASLFGAFNLKDKRQLDDDNNDYIVAHELFHQWFGDYVTAESWSNLTLNESFADYGEYLWSEYKYGKAAAQEIWQQGLGKYMGQAKRKDPPLVRFQYADQEEMFDRVSYSKGGLILNYMRALAGDEAFFETLHRYLKQNAIGSTEATQLRLALEQVTGRDWNWFFNQWYYRGGHPKLELSYTYDDARQVLLAHVLQTQPDSTGLYSLPLKAQLIAGPTITETDWLVDQKEETFSYPYINGQRPVFIPDSGHWLPGELKDKKSVWQWQQQYLHSDDHLSRKLALAACIALKNNDTAQQVMIMALDDKDAVLKTMTINAKAIDGKKGIVPEWASKLVTLASNDVNAGVRAAALAALGTSADERYTSIYELGISDSSYKVAATALNALDKVSHKRALEYARKLNPGMMKANVLLYAIAEILAKEGLTADYHFFEQKSLQLFENPRSIFLLSVKEYLAHTKEEETYRKGVGLLQRLAINKADANQGLFIASLLRSLKSDADREVKRTTDKETADAAKVRRTIARDAWEAYKSRIKDEKIKEEALSLEKDQE